jgi:hypothetical protein
VFFLFSALVVFDVSCGLEKKKTMKSKFSAKRNDKKNSSKKKGDSQKQILRNHHDFIVFHFCPIEHTPPSISGGDQTICLTKILPVHA